MRVPLLGAMVALLLAGCTTIAQPEPLSGLSDSEEELYAQSFALQWSGIELDNAPTVDVVAYLPSAGWGTAVAGCMNAAGYGDYASTAAGMSFPPRDGTDEAENRALYTCIGEYPVQADFSAYANRAQLEFLYDYFQDSLVPCIEANGYLVPDTAPSREQFLEFTITPRWHPYKAMEARPPALLMERCPASPFSAGLMIRY